MSHSSHSSHSSNLTHVNRRAQQGSYDMHDAGRRSLAPASSDKPSPSSSTRHATINNPQEPAKPRPTTASTAAPARRTFFDPWNSSSTGHQRAENRLSGSTSWRVSRNLKLGEQYRAGRDGGKRVADTVGAGSIDFGEDGRKDNGAWEHGAKGLRPGRQKSLAEVWGASKAGNQLSPDKSIEAQHPSPVQTDGGRGSDQGTFMSTFALCTPCCSDLEPQSAQGEPSALPAEKQLFTGLCFYINGSTAPLVSDHKLKQLLALHGARQSIALGGGLAATKVQKEIARTGGKAVRFITAEWVIESINAGRRLPEARFSPSKLASKSQISVFGMLRTKQQDQG
ncbi:hypothetical protein T440DRAFT_487093 [Plenodomus tracheiphilus IPT5]|uniref:BRCT domain-containing protein n=1 Tax=Plenodomus tracheiphilus IPT5 TaxID=1408161 RepID=A0A6A7BHC1_9PLEO|nr:hypothetical protein T440DRAFT_487093 [Plenodomus tracheiphilus IPT5]